MQSDVNSFGGDVVYDGFNMAIRDKENILDLHYEEQICSGFYYDDFNYL